MIISPFEATAQVPFIIDFNTDGQGVDGDCTGPNSSTCSVENFPSAWSLTGNFSSLGNNDFFITNNGHLTARDLDSEICLETQTINISGAGPISFYVAIAESGDHENTDYVDVKYSLDGAPPVTISDWENDGGSRTLEDDFGGQIVQLNNLTGNSLKLYVCVRNNAGDEYIAINEIGVFEYNENPDLNVGSCEDFRVILVLDESGSIQDAGAESEVRSAAIAMVDGLTGSGAELAVVEFASIAVNSNIAMSTGYQIVTGNPTTAVGGATGYVEDFEDYINANYDPRSMVAEGIWTNWEDAFNKVLNLPPADIVIVVTDGNPTAINTPGTCPPGTFGCDGTPYSYGCTSCNISSSLPPAIFPANTVRGQGSHIFVLGVGSNIGVNNIKAISGDDADLCADTDAACQIINPTDPSFGEADYALIPFSELETCLSQIATIACNTSVQIDKTVYLGHDAGASCPGVENVSGPNGTDVTYCFSVTNTGDAPLSFVSFSDPALGINAMNLGAFNGAVTVTSGSWPLGVGQTIDFYVNSTITADLVNTATITGQASGESPVSDSDDASVTLIQDPPCGDCHISGPSGPVCPDSYQFTANFDGQVCMSPQVSWTVDDGMGNVDNYNGNPLSVDLDDCGKTYTITANIDCDDCTPGFITCSKQVTIDNPGQVGITCPPDVTVGCNDSTDPADTGMASCSHTCGNNTPPAYNDMIIGGNNGGGPNNSNSGIILSCDEQANNPDRVFQAGPHSIFYAGYENIGSGQDCQTCFYYCVNSVDVQGTMAISHVNFGDLVCGNTCLEDQANVPSFGTWAFMNGNTVLMPGDGDPEFNDDDPQTGICGLKFDEEFGNETRGYYICVTGTHPEPSIVVPTLTFAVKHGGNTDYVLIPGPGGPDACDYPCEPTTNDCTYTIKRTWTCTDACGTTASCDQVITVMDDAPPTITCPDDVTVECGGSTSPMHTGVAMAVDDCDDNVMVMHEDEVQDGNCPGTKVITRTWKAMDDCGQMATCVQTITVVDTQAPDITDAGDSHTIQCPHDPQFTPPTATDTCDPNPEIIMTSDNIDPGDCPAIYSRTKCWKARDCSGNFSAEVCQTITVVDNEPPTIHCPDSRDLECDEMGVCLSFDGFNAGDFVDVVNTSLGSVEIDGLNPDFGGGTNAAMIFDSGNPTGNDDDLGTPNSAFAGPGVGAAGAPGKFQNDRPFGNMLIISTDLDQGDPDDHGGAGSAFTFDFSTIGTVTLEHLNLIDVNGQAATGDIKLYGPGMALITTINFVDGGNNSVQLVNLGPTAGVEKMVLNINGSGAVDNICFTTGPATGFPTAMDDCDDQPNFSYVDQISNGNCPMEKTVTRVWTVRDACGNADNCTQVITYMDTTPPMIGDPGPPMTLECPADPQFTPPTATDNCDPDPEIIMTSDNTDDGDCPGTYVRTKCWKAKDCSDNYSAEVCQTITVVDTTNPTISDPGPTMIAECPAQPVFIPPTATDNCDPNPMVMEVSDNTDPGNCPGTYTRTVCWKAVDCSGNESATVCKTVTVVDTTNPTISDPGPTMIVECPADPVFTPPTASDDCDPNPMVMEVSDNTDPGNCPGTYTRTVCWKAVDCSGNESATVCKTVTVVDTTNPTISDPGPTMIVECPADPVFTPPTATDDCDPNPTVMEVSDNTDPGNCPGTYTRTVCWKAVDCSGNESATVCKTVTVVDTQMPVISDPGAGGFAECPDDPVFTPPTATDDCDPDPSIIEVVDDTIDGDCPGTYTRVKCWIARDCSGNETGQVCQTIVVRDTQGPTLSGAGSNHTLECPADPAFTPPTATDECDPDPIVMELSDDTTQGDCPGTYTRTVCWIAVDCSGNQSETICQTITVRDTTDPEISDPGPDHEVECPGQPVFTPPTATDTCDPNPEILEVSDSTTPGNCPNTYQRTVCWQARDCSGNRSAVVCQTIRVMDNSAPNIGTPGPDLTIECPEEPNFTPPLATDSCDPNPDIVEVSDNTTPGDCPGTYRRTVCWAARDCSGNTSATVCQTITVVDTGDPVIGQPGPDDTIECLEQPVFTPPTATDDCDPAPSVNEVSNDILPGDCPGTYQQRVCWQAEDCTGNTSAVVCQTITVADSTDPVIGQPGADGAVECPGQPVFTPPTATDDCDPAPVVHEVSNDITPGDCAGTYQQRVCWQAEDCSGNTSAVVCQTLWVVDTTDPEIGAPGMDMTIECPEAPVFTPPTATDNCDSAPTVEPVSSSIAPGDCPGTYRQTICWEAVDCAGNRSAAVCQTITVVDTTDPEFDNIPDLDDIACDDDLPSLEGVTASDTCDEDVDVVGAILPYTEDVCNGYSITYRWTATDDCGNSVSDTETFNVLPDTEAPMITPDFDLEDGETMTVECDNADPNWTPFIYDEDDVSVSDNCSNVTVTMTDELVSEGTCGVSDYLSIWRCTWTATDDCGNSSEFEIFLRIVDTRPPNWDFFPPDASASCNYIPAPVYPEASDDCSEVSLSLQESTIPGDCQYSYTLVRTWTATDGCGNSTSRSQEIAVSDNSAPNIYFIEMALSGYQNGDEVIVECNQLVWVQKLDNAAVAVDDCDPHVEVEYSYVEEDFQNCEETGYVGSVYSTWTATDDCGNTRVVNLRFLLVDETPPILQGVPEDVCVTELPPVPAVQAYDECEFAILEYTQSDPIDCGGGQYIDRTWTATDLCGNTSSATQRITLMSGAGPEISINYPGLEGLASGSSVDLEADCPSGVGLPDLTPFVEVVNACTEVSWTLSQLSFPPFDCSFDGFLLSYDIEITATDICGNSSTYSLTVNIVDTEGPSFAGVPDAITIACGEGIPVPAVADLCSGVVGITITDNVDAIISCPDSPASFTQVWMATDGCGNTSTFSQEVTIIDSEGPVLSGVPEDTCGDPATIPVPTVEAVDECTGDAATVNFSESSVQGACGLVSIRTWSATDACGNTSTAEQRIYTGEDNDAPVLSFVHPWLAGLEDGDVLTISTASAMGNPQDLPEFGADAVAVNDACVDGLSATAGIILVSEGNCEEDGYLTRHQYSWTATDPCGNTGSISFVLEYVDDYAPDIFNVPDDITIYCEEDVPPPGEVLVKDDYDTAGTVVSVSDQTTGTAYGYRIVRTWTATDPCGNTSSASQIIDVIANDLQCNFTPTDEVDCNSDGNELTVIVTGGQPPYTYQWDMIDCDGFITGGQGTSTITYTVGYTTQNFAVTVTDANGCWQVCTVSIACEKDRESGEGEVIIFDLGGPGFSAVYPNPARDFITIEPRNWSGQSGHITMYNLYGQQVIFRSYNELPDGAFELNVSELPSGTYYLKVFFEKDHDPITHQLVIMRNE